MKNKNFKSEQVLTSSDISYLEGEILTIIDSIIPSTTQEPVYAQGTNGQVLLSGSPIHRYSQNSAVKSLVKSAFSRMLSKVGVARS